MAIVERCAIVALIVVTALAGVAAGEEPRSTAANATPDRPTVLILCTGNSARSQMAEGLLKHLAGDRYRVLSAGTKPAERVNPFAVRAMSELGLDISAQTPKHMDKYVGQVPIDHLIAVCASADSECPGPLPGVVQRLSWPFDDPAAVQGTDEEKLAAFRRIRDQIRDKLKLWIAGGKP